MLSDMTERRADQPIRKQGLARCLGGDVRWKAAAGLLLTACACSNLSFKALRRTEHSRLPSGSCEVA